MNTKTDFRTSRGSRRITGAFLVRLLFLIGIANACSVAIAREIPQREVTASENDYALREKLLEHDLAGFNHYLEVGADPTEWLDDSQYGWVMCASTESGKEEFLESLISHGFDVNFRQSHIGSAISMPLTCAIRFRNLNAIKILIDHGADPSLSTCPTCRVKEYPTSLSLAVMVRKYELAVYLLNKARYHEEELKSIVRILERSAVDETSAWNKYRLELADMLREKGYEVTPWTRQKDPD